MNETSIYGISIYEISIYELSVYKIQTIKHSSINCLYYKTFNENAFQLIIFDYPTFFVLHNKVIGIGMKFIFLPSHGACRSNI